MKRAILVLFLFVLAVSSAFSADFIADYVDGFLDVKDGGQWDEVYIGDTLPSNAVVKLYEESYAEISYGNELIKLSRPGTYELSKLMKSRNQIANAGTSSLFSGKFRTLLQDEPEKSQTTVGGVRAAEAETVSIDWMSSETADLIADGKSALDEGEFEDAYDYFTDAYDFSADSYEESEALYFLGLTSAMTGKFGEALENLDMADVEEDSEYYTDFYLLKGQLLVESYAYDEAFKFLSGYDTDAGKILPAKLQEVYFLMAVAGNNSGNINAAKSAVTKLIAIDPSSETARAARKYRESL